MRPEADARVGAEVAEDLPLRQLLVHRLELRHVHGHRPAAAFRLTWRADAEAARICTLDQELRLPQRVRANPFNADLLDQVIAGRARIERRDIRRPREESRDP